MAKPFRAGAKHSHLSRGEEDVHNEALNAVTAASVLPEEELKDGAWVTGHRQLWLATRIDALACGPAVDCPNVGRCPHDHYKIAGSQAAIKAFEDGAQRWATFSACRLCVEHIGGERLASKHEWDAYQHALVAARAAGLVIVAEAALPSRGIANRLDIVFFTSVGGEAVCAVQIDGEHHTRKAMHAGSLLQQQQYDAMVNAACLRAGLPLARLDVYSKKTWRSDLDAITRPPARLRGKAYVRYGQGFLSLDLAAAAALCREALGCDEREARRLHASNVPTARMLELR